MVSKFLINQQTEFLADSIPHILWQSDSNGKMKYFNKAWSDLTKLTLEQSMGDKWLNNVYEEDRDQLLILWNKSKKLSLDFEMECRLITSKGDIRWHLFKAKAEKLDNSCEISSWIGTCTDIHESKNNFLSYAAHELKTPLSVLGLKLHILKRELQRELKNQSDSNLLSVKIESSINVCVDQTQIFSDLLDELINTNRDKRAIQPNITCIVQIQEA